jgi:Na+/H+ antiporter NhaD/arsenite permease-like protein
VEIAIVSVFVVGYVLIAFEHPLQINKSATALLTGVFCWTIYAVASPESAPHIGEQLQHHLSESAAIIFFLVGAMTIVELIDAYHGFDLLTTRITTTNPKTLLWVVCFMAFILSAILDNLTTAIVMVSLVRKLVPNKSMRLLFVGMIVVSSNAGGAWSPIGDVTTTMLWIGGQISALNIMETLLIPSLVCMTVPLLYLQFTLSGTLGKRSATAEAAATPVKGATLILTLGLLGLISVPVFKTITHLPPYLGMLLVLGILWVVSELLNPHMDESERKPYTAAGALARIDIPSILFFLGILLAVGALESTGILQHFSTWLETTLKDNRLIITLVGILSSVVDNVPLVAASTAMYSLDRFPTDHMIWEYLAYCAGTGGSILIIGSAAGVAVMGMEKIDFLWYLRRISLLALVGYLAGAIMYFIIYPYLFPQP